MASSEAAQQFNLRWNNHTNNILQVFAEQLCSESLVDVTISCQGKFLKAHKMVLSACSPYFQELFQLHQVAHPVIIINGMSYLDIKLVIEFMYRGEVKVQENDLGGLLVAAETLQVKGLANVRNKYEKGQIQENGSFETSQKDGCTMETDDKQESQLRSRRKSSLSTDHNFDDDLPTTIKVEPPDIKDIDDEENNHTGWDSPRLVIDMKESKEAISDRMDSLERRRPNILRQPIKSIRVSTAKLDTSESTGGSSSTVRDISGSSAKCFLWQKSKPKLLASWGRTKGCKIPRPPNAFMIFANDWRKKIATKFPVESNKDISIRLGTMWKNLDADTKEAYYSAARRADEEHKIKYPGYYYSPKEARLRKGIKRGRIIGVPQMDALRFVKVYMTSSEKNNLLAKESTSSTSLLRKLNPSGENVKDNTDHPSSPTSTSPATSQPSPEPPKLSDNGYTDMEQETSENNEDESKKSLVEEDNIEVN